MSSHFVNQKQLFIEQQMHQKLWADSIPSSRTYKMAASYQDFQNLGHGRMHKSFDIYNERSFGAALDISKNYVDKLMK
jgi:hypothetical protein